MAWDFSTEPEFAAQLDWMRAFVRTEIWPLETIFDELTQAEVDRFGERLGTTGDPAAQRWGWLKAKFGLSWQIVPTTMAQWFSGLPSGTWIAPSQ